MSHIPAYCPIHEYERARCSSLCLQARTEFRHTSQLLRAYWWHRKRGMRALPAEVYAQRFYGPRKHVRAGSTPLVDPVQA